MKLEGSISIFPLRELIDMVAYSSVTGALNVYDTLGSGHCYFRDGRLYHVTYNALNGRAALEALFAAQNSHFTFVSDVTVEEETLWGNIQYLLDASEQNAERWQRIRTTIPADANLPRLSIPLEHAQHLMPHCTSLLALIDGTRTLALLQQELNWELVDLCETLVTLVEQRIVTLEAVESTGLLTAVNHSSVLFGERGIFERIAAHRRI